MMGLHYGYYNNANYLVNNEMCQGFQKYLTIDEDEEPRTIPKISLRPRYGYKKNLDVINRNKKIYKSQDSLLGINEQYKVNQRLLDLENQLGVNIIQRNGQRRLGPPPYRTGPPPPNGCEIFIGRIPRNIYEDVIYPIFRSIGEIYELRLMMNFSGTNKGYGFIMYERPEDAQRAIQLLNGYEIQPGWFIGVVESVNNCRLHITHLPPDKPSKDIIELLWSTCEDIENIYVFTSSRNQRIKHALVTFKTHRGAAMARRRLLPERNTLFEKHEIKIEWAHPKTLLKHI